MTRLAICCALLVLSGCGTSEPSAAPVQGRVLYGGRPLAGGAIVFAPDGERGASGPLSTATIGRDGTYRLASEEYMGAAPGWYRVAIAPDPAAPAEVAARLQPFRNPQLSGLSREVKAGGNTFDFHIDDS
jgi:hypothetical protein